MVILTNDVNARSLCISHGIRVDELSLEETQMLAIDGLYIFVQRGGHFEKLDGLKDLQKLLNN